MGRNKDEEDKITNILGFDRESASERELRYKALFHELDVYDEGKLTTKSLKTAFRRKNHPLRDSDVAIQELFRSMDSNHDNEVDFDDFKKFAFSAEHQIDKGFKKLDSDNDGFIKLADVSKYLSKLEKTNHIVIDNTTLIGNDIDAEANTCRAASQSKKKTFASFARWAFNQKYINKGTNTDMITNNDSVITYKQWRDFLFLMPRKSGSRLHTAFSYYYLFKEDVDLSSEGDVTLINEFFRGFAFFVAGGVSGVISRTCTAPFDRIKVFLIARTDLSSTILNSKEDLLARNPKANIDKLRSPIVKAITSLYRQGGIKAFYVGNGLNTFKVFPESSIKFGTFEMMKKLMTKIEGCKDKSELSKPSTFIAGGLAGMAAQFSVYPIDTLKFRIQCAPLANLQDKNILINTAKQMYRDGGPLIFYRGLTAGLLGMFPYAALDLGTFSILKKWLIARKAKEMNISEKDVTLSNFTVIPLGAFSGSVGASVVYPINLLRTRLQAQGTYAHPYTYTGIRDVLQQTIQREGYPGLYKGLMPTLAKVCPAVSISYLCYENIKRAAKLE
ncbi:similar to Saccharomyces cerevisiae YNL083W SAL1 ADP/ATP transporter [Maudiozyma saulgeensis]|uniref:Similar to Saccharomyces cerevisiae YNL083W SAL1 ADP/ATP transporter n=1 Tax=Maudiozyma saulgeensis TaxID=1789683 RepID=A0A1X7QYZ1_9SACH|nr:similar to Saccharomyces cerevisiae YNL083W SAL1 ADP/ATP transporter [Kazachstania saulgeensis]